MICGQFASKLLVIIGLIFIIQFVVIDRVDALSSDSEIDSLYRIFNAEQPCAGEECL